MVAHEFLGLVKASHESAHAASDLNSSLMFALLGAVFAFLAGLLALRWLSNWLENGRWYLFGVYCMLASAVVLYLHHLGY